MKYLVKNKQLTLRYEPGKGAWTYHIAIPGTKDLPVRWGYTKVSGSIDGYKITSKNLFSITGADKMVSINAQIRNAIGKGAGDTVRVTLYLVV